MPGFLLHQWPDVGMILTQRVRLRRAWAEGQRRYSSSLWRGASGPM